MEPTQFINSLIADIVDMNSLLYARLFDDELLAEKPRDDLDPEFRRTLDVYGSLTFEQQEALISRFRQITVDSLSSILGVIDGSSSLKGFPGEFRLTYNGQQMGEGDLQDRFLEAIEELDKK